MKKILELHWIKDKKTKIHSAQGFKSKRFTIRKKTVLGGYYVAFYNLEYVKRKFVILPQFINEVHFKLLRDAKHFCELINKR